MTPYEKLQWLYLNAHTVNVQFNDHRSYYETVRSHLEDKDLEVDAGNVQACIAADRIVEVRVYPITPIGFHVFVHPDLDRAIDDAYAGVRDELERKNGTTSG